jgi:broad specificity phosphatase PhoE
MSINKYILITPISIDRSYDLRDPPLTEKGFEHAEALSTQLSTIFKIKPSVIVTSPMTRTIQTARTLFPYAFTKGPDAIPLHIWPGLREAHDANCNKGRSRAEMQALHAGLYFSACDEEWNYEPHHFEDAAERAEVVRQLSTIVLASWLTCDHQKFAPTDLRMRRSWRNVALESMSSSANTTLDPACLSKYPRSKRKKLAVIIVLLGLRTGRITGTAVKITVQMGCLKC